MTGNKMKDQSSQSRALEGLPPKFVTAMRTLFDVLDDNKSGTVSLADIEHWWRKDRDEHGGGTVPNGVIESLRFVFIIIQRGVSLTNIVYVSGRLLQGTIISLLKDFVLG